MFRVRSPRRLTACLIAPVLLLGLASAQAADRPSDEVATANQDEAVVSRAVSIADLNLAFPEDQRKLRHRLSVAARRVCMEVVGTTVIQDDGLMTCYQTSMHDAWASVQDRILVATARANLLASARQAPVRSQEVASSAGR